MWRDAVVIGGGPAGATVATLLARAGWSVAVIEASEFPRRKVCGEFLSAANLPLLRQLGVADDFLHLAGPAVKRVGVFAGAHTVTADMPRLDCEDDAWGRALGREHLDTLLLDRAAASGAAVWQPYTGVGISGTPGHFTCTIAPARLRSAAVRLQTPVVIAAYGSWHQTSLATQPPRTAPRSSDLFGFKARFTQSRLQHGLMPLLAFPGGYGGMVHTDHNCVSLSCCVRREQLERCRRVHPGLSAGAAVLAHIMHNCDGVRDALHGASLEPQSWRAVGPIQPGIRGTRSTYRKRGQTPFSVCREVPGMYLIGNAAGEAHPVIAEGISMAMQSAWLLAHDLLSGTAAGYDRDWRRAFVWRIRAASMIAHWAMRPAAVMLTLPLLRAFPMVLTGGAKTTGKVSVLCSPSC